MSLTSNIKLGHIAYVGGVLKLSEPADFKTDSGFENCLIFVGVIEENNEQSVQLSLLMRYSLTKVNVLT